MAAFIGLMPLILEAQADIDAVPAGAEIQGTSCTPANVGTYDASGEGCGDAAYTCSARGLCVEPAGHYDSISIGLTFTALPAEIDPDTIYVAP
jgi:hypothetical protein